MMFGHWALDVQAIAVAEHWPALGQSLALMHAPFNSLGGSHSVELKHEGQIA